MGIVDPNSIEIVQKDHGRQTQVSITFHTQGLQAYMFQEVLRCAADLIAQKFCEEYFQDIAALINPQALANLSIASAGAKINETLAKKLPDRVDVVHVPGENAVYQRGLFGGMTRIR